MKRSFLRHLFPTLILCPTLATASCASHADAPTPLDAVDRAIDAPQAEEPLIQELTQKKQKPYTELLMLDSGMALRQDGSWTFSPDFLLSDTPDAALMAIERAILENDADSFCADFRDVSDCKRLFSGHARLFSDAYIADSGTHAWQKNNLGVFIALAPLKLFFSLDQGNWRFTGFCQTVENEVPGFPNCP